MNSHNELLNKLDTLDSEVDINETYEDMKKMYVQPITKKEFDELSEELNGYGGVADFNHFKFYHLFRNERKYLEFYREIIKLNDEQEEDFF